MSDNRVRSFKTPQAQATIERIKAVLVRESGNGVFVDRLALEIGLTDMDTLNFLRHMGRKELAHMRPTRKWFPGEKP